MNIKAIKASKITENAFEKYMYSKLGYSFPLLCSCSLFFSVSVFVTAGLWLCVSDPSLLQSLLSKPQQARIHLQFVRTCLPHLEQFALQVNTHMIQ
jgi:hypothetical protein